MIYFLLGIIVGGLIAIGFTYYFTIRPTILWNEFEYFCNEYIEEILEKENKAHSELYRRKSMYDEFYSDRVDYEMQRRDYERLVRQAPAPAPVRNGVRTLYDSYITAQQVRIMNEIRLSEFEEEQEEF